MLRTVGKLTTRTNYQLLTPKAFLSNNFHYGNIGIAVLRKKDMEEVHHSDPGHDSEVFKSKELFGTGSQIKHEVPTAKDHATGKERIEYELTVQGKDPYFGMLDALDNKKVGTKKDPIIVVSPDSDRYVGCVGHPGHPHPQQQVWLQVTEDGHKYWAYGHNRCSECGNVFKLKRIDIPYPTIN